MSESKRRGRPLIGQYGKKEVFQKLEPYLKVGMSLRKACREAKVNRAWVYTLKERDENFADQITRAHQYLSVTVCGILAKELFRIAAKQRGGEEISNQDTDFLMWFALHSTLTAEEYGRRKDVVDYDPEIEIQRVMRMAGSLSI